MVARSVDLQPPPELQVFAENRADTPRRNDVVLRLNHDSSRISGDTGQRLPAYGNSRD